MSVPQEPQRPCDAYQPIADLLGPVYLERRPPSKGLRVRVAGRDGLISEWDVAQPTARAIVNLVNRRQDLRWVSAIAYDEQAAA